MEAPDAVGAPPEGPSRPRLWLLRIGAALGVAALVLVAAVSAWLYPYFLDDYLLDGVVRAVALDWRDFGEVRARERLTYELDHQDIGLHVRDEDCRLEQSPEGVRRVACGWGVEVAVPGLELRLPLSFTSLAEIDATGDLR